MRRRSSQRSTRVPEALGLPGALQGRLRTLGATAGVGGAGPRARRYAWPRARGGREDLQPRPAAAGGLP
eukprot:2118576-Alexandrium_andersonii.AAC.1